MLSRSLFYIVMSASLLGISSLGTAMYMYICPSMRSKRLFWSIQCIVAIILIVTMYYQLSVTTIEQGTVKDFLRIFSIEGNGIIIGIIISTLLFVIAGLVKWIYNIVKKMIGYQGNPVEEGSRMSRRTFLKTSAAIVPAVTLGGASLGAFRGASEVITTHYDLEFKDIPEYLRGYRIAQLTDVHIGPFIDLEDFDALIERVALERPNRLVITGDIIDDLGYLDGLVEKLKVAVHKFPDGIDYILGNHEYIRDVDLILKKLSSTPIRIYRNSSRLLHDDGSRPVYMVGVDYNFKKEREWNPIFMDTAMKHVPSNAFVILLAHHPSFIGDAFERNIPVTLTGHTHGGQINVFGISLVPVARPFWKGMYRDDKGHYGYVGNGAGHWFPVRWNCPREVTIFTFKDKQ